MLTRGITTPFYFRLSGLPAEVRPHFLPAWLEMGDGLRKLLLDARVDALVVVGLSRVRTSRWNWADQSSAAPPPRTPSSTRKHPAGSVRLTFRARWLGPGSSS